MIIDTYELFDIQNCSHHQVVLIDNIKHFYNFFIFFYFTLRPSLFSYILFFLIFIYLFLNAWTTYLKACNFRHFDKLLAHKSRSSSVSQTPPDIGFFSNQFNSRVGRHGISKWTTINSNLDLLHLSGEDHIHVGTVVGKLEGERDITLSFVDWLRDDFIEKDQSHDIYFTQDWVSLPGVLPVTSSGIHVWHVPTLTEIFRDDSVLQFTEELWGTLGVMHQVP